MNVAKSTRTPRSTIAHLLCVPGSTASTPGIVIAQRPGELRLLAAHDVGHAGRVDAARARDDRELAARASRVSMPASAARSAGQST